ncbi:Hypothetical predicted protein [Paramuricea clavata]|uniref:Uncharacterized protein n=1 Tax=Paramuricea clavata TaxID=317549 RepID=A0A6S7GKS1_PARCT|nr:Hypothetical predicted protein [Paramuricea clavata]
MDEVKIMLERNQFDILAVCEMHLSKKIGNRQLQVDGYRTIQRDCPDGRRGGGMVVFVLKTLTAVHLKHLDHEKIEAIWLRIVTKSSSVTIGSFYRSPDNMAFFEDIVIPLEKAWYKYKNLVLVGDFNVNFSKTAHGHELRLQEKLMSALVQFDCSVINKDFTRVTPTTETMIDLIITNKADLVENIKTADTGISDHNLVSFSMDFNPRKVPPRIVTIRNCKKMEIEKFKLDLQNAPWCTCEMFDDIEDKCSVWTDIFKDICEEHAPKRKVKLRRQTLPWMRHKMNRRYKALQKAKKERNNEGLWKEYRKLRNEVTAELRRAKSTYFAELANCQKINTRKYWKILNQASGKESNMKTIRAIKSDTGALVTNDREIANILNKHFATTGEKLAGLLNSHYVPTVELIDRISPTVMEIEIQEENVKENLLRLNTHKATGPDDLPPILLRAAAEEIAPSLTDIFQTRLCDSEREGVDYGVPQGSVLGLLLFALFCDDLPDCARHDDEELEMYVDDTTLTSIGETVDQVILKLNETLGLVSKWCYKNGMTVHPAKAEAMLIKRGTFPPVQLNGSLVKWVRKSKSLGVTLDN